jgi:hypothetical protein
LNILFANIFFIFFLFKALSQRSDFSDSQIDAFQILADDFFSAWLNLIGYDGVTNYIHMLGAGHIRYFLQKWRNLHRFSNQGWEAYNALVANYWHHRTQKGGGRGEKSKIKAIAMWLLRVMMWRTGEGDNFFKNIRHNNENDDISDYSSDDDDDYI